MKPAYSKKLQPRIARRNQRAERCREWPHQQGILWTQYAGTSMLSTSPMPLQWRVVLPCPDRFLTGWRRMYGAYDAPRRIIRWIRATPATSESRGFIRRMCEPHGVLYKIGSSSLKRKLSPDHAKERARSISRIARYGCASMDCRTLWSTEAASTAFCPGSALFAGLGI